ncbi:hypothetical protein GHA01_26420 [Novacetimonas hansenii]|uniref:Uncharacterized protein n=2 Tax=Novacetimonas hansenii TaxID=436 RepID=A0ABQ0SHW2_NOVHA|nr:hypothetical protein GXY_04991 [Novacetimonas hansenii ATCC 23769]GAN82796.1 hypothetical protein Gaha_0043_010 [Novacetimonas hansenii JCM 7643]GBQ53249.1 hypothetical protein AA0243_0276 [Novacetimonas hansenii NRIC 0243]GEC64793.1 hypothetical protein GHA01_26420 [Novacetimonas hansenii]
MPPVHTRERENPDPLKNPSPNIGNARCQDNATEAFNAHIAAIAWRGDTVGERAEACYRLGTPYFLTLSVFREYTAT